VVGDHFDEFDVELVFEGEGEDVAGHGKHLLTL
jgi:hypothetical protein